MVRIVSDSTCDLSKEILDRYDISIIPLRVRLGDNEYEDGVDITQDDIYKWVDANKSTPTTCAESIESVIDVIKPLTDAGDEVVCFAISEDMSTSANVMRLAAESLGVENLVHVIDSANLSSGIGLLVVAAAEKAMAGSSAADVVDYIEGLKPRVRASFVVDTLMYLYRGGRCSGLEAYIGSALKLHPKIVVENGKMHSAKNYRGKIDKVIRTYVEDMEEDLLKAMPDRVFITHSVCSQESLDFVREYLEGLNHFKEIFDTDAGCVVTSHCGPGTLGVLFVAG